MIYMRLESQYVTFY